MPGNWDLFQKINFGHAQHRVEWPTGPMKLTTDEEPKWVDAWTVQFSTGASQGTRQWTNWKPGHDRWTADSAGWINGKFGGPLWPAVGIALLASTNKVTGVDDVFPWIDLIVLK